MHAKHLTIEPSAVFKGMGSVGVGLPSNDPAAAYYNPANGLLNMEDGIAVTRVNIPYQFADNQKLNYSYNQISITPKAQGAQFQFAAGYHVTQMQLITPKLPYATSDQQLPLTIMEHGLTAALGYRQKVLFIPLALSIGLAWKSGILSFADQHPRGHFMFADFGAMFSTPFQKYLPNRNVSWKLEPAIGYSNANNGVTNHPSVGDLPSPRGSRVGLSLSGGLLKNNNRDIFSFKYGRSIHLSYFINHSNLGDIDVGEYLLERKGSDEVSFKEGFEFGFFGLVALRAGMGTILSSESILNSRGFSLYLGTILFDLGRFFSIRPLYNFAQQFDLRFDLAYRESDSDLLLSDRVTYLISLGLKNPW